MTRVEFAVAVDLPHPPEVAFRYLVDPRNRPEWQASLLSVRLEDREAEPAVGVRWRDNTVVGLKPELVITELEPYRLFSEHGTWRGVSAVLTLRFVATPRGCRVVADGAVEGDGIWAAAAKVSGRVAATSIRGDLRRAGRVLSDRGPR